MDDKQTHAILAKFPRSPIWDEKTQSLADASRAFIHRRPQPTISQLQKSSLKSKPLNENFNVVSAIVPVPPEDDARVAFFKALRSLGKFAHDNSSAAEVPLEWVGHRSKRSSTIASKDKQPADAWKALSTDVESNITILHIHGGGLFQGSPASYRSTTSKLAKLTKGRVCSVGYRLCPQHAFPAGLLDVFMAYLTLLYPPPGSSHEAIDPSTIVIAGDSSGALYGFSLLLVLTQINKQGPISFHSRRLATPVPLPAGIAGMSPAGEQIQSMRSYEANRVHDLFLNVPWAYPDYPACQLWPTKPPRASIMAREIMDFVHPLISPCLATNWKSCPPMWFGVGQEQYVDGAKAIARRASQQGVPVTWYEFEAMPHCFATLPGFSAFKQSSMLFEQWAAFCRRCVESPDSLMPSPQAYKVNFKDLKVEEQAFDAPNDPSFAELEYLVKARLEEMQREFDRDWSSSKDGMTKL